MIIHRHLQRLYYLDNHFNNQMEVARETGNRALAEYIWTDHARPNDRAILVAEHYAQLLERECERSPEGYHDYQDVYDNGESICTYCSAR